MKEIKWMHIGVCVGGTVLEGMGTKEKLGFRSGDLRV